VSLRINKLLPQPDEMMSERHSNAVSNLEQERIRYIGPYRETRKGRCAGTYLEDRLLP
jgi:hypothetical protein